MFCMISHELEALTYVNEDIALWSACHDIVTSSEHKSGTWAYIYSYVDDTTVTILATHTQLSFNPMITTTSNNTRERLRTSSALYQLSALNNFSWESRIIRHGLDQTS